MTEAGAGRDDPRPLLPTLAWKPVSCPFRSTGALLDRAGPISHSVTSPHCAQLSWGRVLRSHPVLCPLVHSGQGCLSSAYKQARIFPSLRSTAAPGPPSVLRILGPHRSPSALWGAAHRGLSTTSRGSRETGPSSGERRKWGTHIPKDRIWGKLCKNHKIHKKNSYVLFTC